MASAGALAAAVSVAMAIFVGPRGVYIASGLGAALAVVSLGLAARSGARDKPVGFPLVVLGVNGLLLLVGAILQAMFLSPLSKDAQKMPVLQTLYSDPDKVFEIRGPSGWTYRPVPSKFESGVRMQPEDQSRYMGVSEATVFVRRLESEPKSPDEFLTSAAAAFSEKESKRKLFDLKTERGKSLSGAPLIWSTITIRRFWVPLYQISLFGVKDHRYLCSVSTVGLMSHATLARLLCMGLFERIEITDRRP